MDKKTKTVDSYNKSALAIADKFDGQGARVEDIEEFEFPQNLDIIIAFASLLHVNKENFKNILERAFKALGPGGIFYISIKYADSYKEVEKEDQFGVRTFYLYSESDMREIVGDFKIIKMVEEEIRNQIWMEVILEKN